MIEEYTTSEGVTLKIGKVDRGHLDCFLADNPEPLPPVEVVEVWGGETEEIERKNDPTYRAALQAYHARLFDAQFDLVAKAVEFEVDEQELDEMCQELEALYMTGLPRRDKRADLLRYVVLPNQQDASSVIEAILYNSTVTKRGLDEAAQKFNVRWMDSPLEKWGVGRAPASYNVNFEARKAAIYQRMSWRDFCKLDGPEQSEIVYFYRADMKLQWLMSQR